MIMKIVVDKLPEKSSECLFCSAEKEIANCMISTKFESLNEHKSYCKCYLDNGARYPYLQKL